VGRIEDRTQNTVARMKNQETGDSSRMKNKKIEPITKAPFDYAQDRRKLEGTEKELVFNITPSSFVFSW
jgi:hypothetical protein